MATETNISGAPTGNVWLDSLIAGSKWTDSDGGQVTITFAAQSGTAPHNGGFLGYTWLAHELTAGASALAAWEAVANIDFVETSSGDEDIWFWSVSSGTIGSSTYGDSELPDPDLFVEPLYVRFNWQLWSAQTLQPGGTGFVTMLHELGHALGLAHPHDGYPDADPSATKFPGVTSRFDDYGDYDLNQGIFTTMSYNDAWPVQYPGHTSQTYGQQATPMALDIAAVQAIYGANNSYNTGNNTYTLPSSNGSGTFWSCIWDTGGTDTISNSASSRSSTIDLNDATLSGANAGGFVSYAATIVGGFTIAKGALIENAIGGSGADTIRGNEGNNNLQGRNGADTILGADGDDTLVGGGGSDFLTGGAGADTFLFAARSDSAADSSRDTVTDFSVAQGDKIDLSGIATFSYLDSAAFSSAANQLRFDGSILAGDTNGDGSADFEIGLSGVSSLAATSIIGVSGTPTPGPDKIAPTLATASPATTATGIAIGANIVLSFSESVTAGTGSIDIVRSDTRVTAASIAVTDTSQVTVSGSTVTINPSTDLAGGASYYVLVAKGAILDASNNAYAGIRRGELSFTTLDTVAPTLTASKPLDDAVQVRPDSTIVLTFDEQVQAGGGNFRLVRTADSVETTIAASDTTQVTFAYSAKKGGTITIDPSTDLVAGVAYHLIVDGNAVTDTSGNAYAGIAAATTLNFLTLDKVAPTLTASTPSNLQTGVLHGANIVLTFSETVRAGTGTIDLVRTDTRAVVQSIAVDDTSQVTISGSTVTINPAADLTDGAPFWVMMAKGALLDASGNSFAGLKKSGLTFTVVDSFGPTLTSAIPADDAVQVRTTANIVLTFNEQVQAGAGNIRLVKTSDSSVTTIAASDTTQVTFAYSAKKGGTVTINPTDDLVGGGAYHVLVDANAITDVSSNAYAGIAAATTLNFITLDRTAPTLASASPSHQATGVAVGANLILAFSEEVHAGTGTIDLVRNDTRAVEQSIAIGDTSQVSFSGTSVTIDPAANLVDGVSYSLVIARGAILDPSGNSFAGLRRDGHTFTAFDSVAPTLASSRPADDTTGVATGASIVLTFSEAVRAGSGAISIVRVSNNATTTISAADATQVTFGTGRTAAVMTINPAADLVAGSDYYVVIDSAAVLDTFGNAYGGIGSASALSFSTAGTAPLSLDWVT